MKEQKEKEKVAAMSPKVLFKEKIAPEIVKLLTIKRKISIENEEIMVNENNNLAFLYN